MTDVRDWGRFALYRGDCRALMAAGPAARFDSIVTDPPYELTGARPGGRSEATRGAVMRGFMGLRWDGSGVAFDVETWRQAYRALKPGGYLLAFGGTRTYHRLACAIEDAGFEIRDQIGWVFGSGFPKSRNGEWGGTALKPAWEPICMARKPLEGTVEENWRKYGTGALNIDDCRVPTDDDLNGGAYAEQGGRSVSQSLHGGSGMNQPGKTTGRKFVQPSGRWPANLIHDGSDEVVAAFPDAPGQIADASPQQQQKNSTGLRANAARQRRRRAARARGDSGSAARFFYCAKASKRDRNEGCEGLPLKPGGMVSNTSGQHITRRDGGAPGPVNNNHPTVKPTELMRYLVRLVTPAGGLVGDPFAGSGSTGKAAMLEGMRFVGYDLDQDNDGKPLGYLDIAERRIATAWLGDLAFGSAA